jgi:hypothetical protein
MSIRLYLPETLFVVASLPLEDYGRALEALMALRSSGRFTSVTRDKDEVTVIISEEEWSEIEENFSRNEVQRRRRMIAFDTVLDFTVVGFIAEISRALAEAGISILNVSTYKTDLVFVDETRFDDAVAAVKQALVTMHYTHLSQQ